MFILSHSVAPGSPQYIFIVTSVHYAQAEINNVNGEVLSAQNKL